MAADGNVPLKPPSLNERAIKAGFKRWSEFLNNAIGLVSFSLALGCLGTHRPATNAFLSFLFVMSIRIAGKDIYPASMRRLQQAAKKRPELKTDVLIQQKKHMPYIRMFNANLPFLFGYVFLFLVMFSHLIYLNVPFARPVLDWYLGNS
jgi:hypothetical protein